MEYDLKIEPMRALIVDDDRALTMYYKAILEKEGYSVRTALRPSEARIAFADHAPDLVVVDYHMPEMTGAMLAAEIRKMQGGVEVGILLISTDDSEETIVEAMHLGITSFLKKPLHAGLFVSICNSLARNACSIRAQTKVLKKSEQRYRSLFDNTLEGIAHCRMIYQEGQPPDFVYLDVNSAFTTLTGLTDVIGKRVSEVIPGIQESNQELFDIYARVAETGKPEKFENFVKELGIWFSISVYQAEQKSFVAVFENITERKQIEQEMIVMNSQLAHEVIMRTADLSALTAHIQKVAEIERANLARELHDELGSTLVGISMELGLLRGKITSPDLLQNLSQIKELLSHAVQIKQEVVNQLYPTVLNHYGLIAAIEWLVNEFRKHSGIATELIAPGEPITIEHTFALAAYRITQECLTNIAKHAEASKVHIKIKTSGGFLDLTMHDNGKGLPGPANTEGHGIFGMIERARYLGGEMKISSQNGTIAHLRLPLGITKPKNKMRVLVVDDHAIVRDAIKQILETQSVEFSVGGEAADGKTAVQMAISDSWDIVLLDISLPKKNGMKVLEEIVAVKPELPIIMLSSHPEKEYREIALAKGAACYIEKGETDRLVEAMRRAVLLHQ